MDEEMRVVANNKPQFQFSHSPLMNKVHWLQIQCNPWLQAAMGNDLTADFIADIEWRCRHESHFDIMIYGDTGSGKSRLSMSIYYEQWQVATKYINPNLKFTADNMAFTRTAWLRTSEQLSRGDTLIFDEDDQSFIGVGALRQLAEQEQIEKTLRQSQFNFIFNSPIMETHVEHYILKAFDIDYSKQLNRAVLYKKDDAGLIMPCGVIVLPRHEVEGYEEKKERFRKAVQARTLTDRFREYDDVAKALIERFKIDKIKKARTVKSLIQRYFPRFTEEEVKEIQTSIDLIANNVELRYSELGM
jgi:ABC-type dipeptide/oligopeptide/nickel transport system ATPase component